MLQTLKLRAPLLAHRRIVISRFYSDDEKPTKKPEKLPKEKKVKNNEESMKRLNALLENMSTSPEVPEVKVIKAKPKEMRQKQDPAKTKLSNEELAKNATSQIVEKLTGHKKEETENELLTKLLGIQDLKSFGSLGDLISSMQVEDKEKEKFNKAANVRRSMPERSDPNERRKQRHFDQKQVKSVVNLFGGKPLGIFEKASTAEDHLKTWQMLDKKEMKLAVTHPPTNYFEKMIMWTEQGKVWKFPINNEQGLDEEFNTDFSEHVLLEMHLEDWCPTSGPVRHFMELVCVGLSNNHYLSAKEKRDHIYWYRDYFNEKKDLLGELLDLGRIPPSKEGGQQQLES